MQIGPLSDRAVAGESIQEDQKKVASRYLVAKSPSITTV
jgi:hypothetical protein